MTAGATTLSNLGNAASDPDINLGDKLSYTIEEVRHSDQGAPESDETSDHDFSVSSGGGLVSYSGSALVDGDVWKVVVQATDLIGDFDTQTLVLQVGGDGGGNDPVWTHRNVNFDVVAGGKNATANLESYSHDGDGGEATDFDVQAAPLLSTGIRVRLSGTNDRDLTISASASASPGTYDFTLIASDDDNPSGVETDSWTITVLNALRAPSFTRSQVKGE